MNGKFDSAESRQTNLTRGLGPIFAGPHHHSRLVRLPLLTPPNPDGSVASGGSALVADRPAFCKVGFAPAWLSVSLFVRVQVALLAPGWASILQVRREPLAAMFESVHQRLSFRDSLYWMWELFRPASLWRLVDFPIHFLGLEICTFCPGGCPQRLQRRPHSFQGSFSQTQRFCCGMLLKWAGMKSCSGKALSFTWISEVVI